MADRILTEEEKAAQERRGAAGGAQRGGPPHMRLGQPTEKSQNFGPSARRLLGLMAPDKVLVWAAMAFALVSVALTALGPKILGRATDLIFSGLFSKQIPANVTQEQAVEGMRAQGETKLADMLAAMEHIRPGQGVDFTAVRNVLLLALALYAVSSLLSWTQARIIVRVVNTAVYRLRRDVEAKLGRLPLSYFDSQPRGELLSRVTNDIDNIAQSLQQTLSQLLTSALTVIAMLAMMFYVSPLLAIIALVTIPISIGITAFIGKRSQVKFVQQWKSTGEVNSIVEESFTGHELVKVFGRRDEVGARFQAVNEELRDATFGAQFISGLIMPMMMFVGNLNYVIIAVVGGLRVASGSMSIGDVQAFIQYSRQFTQPLTQVASMANLMQSGVASAERVFEVLDAPEQTPDPAHPETLVDPHGRVSFEDVSFSYTPDRPLIEHLNLCVEPGQTVAIVGPTGAGKTTLVNLIMRFYEVDDGRITLDGKDITDLTRDNLRSQIGMVLQDTWLFGGTIRDNIAYGRPDASEEDILEAARATYVDRFVHSLPEGYDTVLDSEAGNISAGEKQLLTIARAFISDPALLILDEATSSVDTRTELLVQQAMANLRQDRTSFVIAHRLSTIRDADLILVMEDGRIVEQGSHAELLERGGAFARLYAAQFAGALTEDAEAGEGAVPRGVPVH
ncbi:MAG TPA: ABC transporter ATP-binding protein [Phycicoccus elongatus]|nr:ABC transporter ATP-binding protein [Phycicoccus elongatus]